MSSAPIAFCGGMFRAAGLVALALLLTMAAANAERRVALVLGNSQYQHAAALANPARDGQAMAGRLKDLGFEVEGTDTPSMPEHRRAETVSVRRRGAGTALPPNA